MTKPREHHRLPLVILLFGIAIALFGLLAIYDASVVEAYRQFGDKFHFVKQQSQWLVLAIISTLVVSSFPLTLIKKYSSLIFLASLFLMLLVLIPGIGSKLLGARRWIILGPIVIQPSELLKISLVLYLSSWLETVRELKQFLFLLSGVMLLVMLQPDLGTGLIITTTCLALYYISGVPVKQITQFVGVVTVAVLLLILASPYRLNRLKTFMDPSSDPLGSSYHINQILYGLGSGGLTGVGIGQSRQKFAYLPEATTDSIFVIIAEEFGFIGSLILIAALVTLAIFSFRVSLNASSKFDKLLSSGISLIFISQIFINLSSMTALVPLTGVPLPFISYGGSSLVTNFISLGLLINVAKRQ